MVFTAYDFFHYPSNVQSYFQAPSITKKSAAEENWWGSKSFQIEGFIYQAEHFSNPNIEPIKKIDSVKYYLNSIKNYLIEGLDMCFPDTISLCLDAYFNLNKEDKRMLRKVFALFKDGLELSNTKYSLSFISFISCIETMIRFEFGNQKIEISSIYN